MKTPTLATRLGRTLIVSSLAVSLLALVTGLLAGTVIVLREEDRTSLAMARIFEGEAARNLHDPTAFAEEMRGEVAEQAGFGRQIEVWRDGRLVAAGPSPSPLGFDPARENGCALRTERGSRWRACVTHAPGDIHIVVASRIEGLVRALLTFALAVICAALAGMAVFASVSRRVVRTTLRPIDELRAAVTRIEGTRLDARVDTHWGVDEIDTLASAFDALLVRMQEATARERQFLFDASHELRTPLTRVRSQIESALADAAPESDAARRLRAAEASCTTLVNVTESILALARGELPRADTVNIADAVRALVAELPEALRARVQLDAVDEALVRADASLVALAARNLLDNALKFTDAAVHVSVRNTADAAELVIEDRGAGIPVEERAAVIRPFYRGARARGTTQGTGLGLALVSHVALAYGGTLTLDDAEPCGLRARLSIPAWTPRAAAR